MPCFVVAKVCEILNKYQKSINVTDHSVVDYSLVMEKAKIIVDTRNALRKFISER